MSLCPRCTAHAAPERTSNGHDIFNRLSNHCPSTAAYCPKPQRTIQINAPQSMRLSTRTSMLASRIIQINTSNDAKAHFILCINNPIHNH